MSNSINDGGPAFPAEGGVNSGLHPCSGMTIRDYFAAQVVQGICAHPDTWGIGAVSMASQSYVIADEMLKAREAK